MDVVTLWQLINGNLISYVFPMTSYGGSELFVIGFFAFISFILLKTGADRISFAFVLSATAGAFAYANISQSPVVYGIILLAGGFLTARGLMMLYEG